MSGFSNPVSNALGTLIRTVLKSQDYAAGVSGWAIFKNGDVEFNGGVFRGSVLIGNPPSTGAMSIGVRGNDIPAVLRNFNADYTWLVATINWVDTQQFFFSALAHNTNFDITETITGVYTTAGGVQLQTFVESSSPNTINYGTDTYDTADLEVMYRNGRVWITDTATLTVQGSFMVSGSFDVDGISQGRGIKQYTAASVNKNIASTEVVVLSIPSFTFEAGRVYEIKILGYVSVTPSTGVFIFKARKGANTITGTVFTQSGNHAHSSTSGLAATDLIMRVGNYTGADISTQWTLAAVTNGSTTGNVTNLDDTSGMFRVEVHDIGDTSMYTNEPHIT